MLKEIEKETLRAKETIEKEFDLVVDEWELLKLGEALQVLIQANEHLMKRCAADEQVQLIQENRRLAYLHQQFEVKRLGKKQALKQLLHQLSFEVDEIKNEEEMSRFFNQLNQVMEVFE